MELNNNMLVLKLEAHKMPVFKEEKSKDWIIFGIDKDWKNRYPDYLTQLSQRSGKHGAILTSKANYIAGGGFEVDKAGINVSTLSIIHGLLKEPNNKEGEVMGDIAYKCALDVETYGGCYLEIIWKNNKKDFEINHIPFARLRLSKEEDGYWYSNDWGKAQQSEEETGLRFIPLFDEENKKGSFIYPYYEYRPDFKYYPVPSYIGGIPYIESDYEIANFHLTNIKTGFHAGTMISFNNGKPTPEEKEATERTLKDKFTGTDRAGSLLLTWTNNKENAPSIERISPSDLDKQFDLLNRTVRDELMYAHRINSPVLFGVATAGTLGQRNEMIDAFEIFKTQYIEPKQRALNIYFKRLFLLRGISTPIKLKIVPPIALQYSEQAKLQVLTKDEIREEMGYKPLEEEKEPETEVSKLIHRFDCHEHYDFKEEELDKTISVFRKYGRKRYNYDVYQRFNYAFAGLLDEDMKEIYRSILDLIEKDSFIDNKGIAEALGIEVSRVNKVVQKLEEAGAFDSKDVKKYGDKVERKILSEKAREIIESNPPKQAEWELRYSYQWNPIVKNRSLKNSRDFCKELMGLDSLYTRSEIDRISIELGYNVFERRGGWWNHGDGVKTPYCRHVWVAEYVKAK